MIDILHTVTYRRTFEEVCSVSQSWKSGSTCYILADVLNKFLLLSQVDSTRDFYKCYLSKSLPTLGLTPKPDEIISFRDNLKCSQGGKHAYHRAMRAFYNWLYSPASGLGFKPEDNPIRFIKPPKVTKKKMPAQTEQSIKILLSHTDNLRDAALLAALIDSSGRLSEVSDIHEPDILWDKSVFQCVAKGGDEVYMPFSPITGNLIREWLTEYNPNGGNIWGIKKSGIVSMLRRLEKSTGIKCNAHTFRRGFASILRRKGIDSLDIMRLGHWKSIGMVQRYTESVNFEDSQKHYKAPMERLADATDGLTKDNEVPRPRIELGTRGFSVRCSTD